MSEKEKSDQQLTQLIELQDKFLHAFPSQDLLEDIPVAALPQEYRPHINIRSDNQFVYVAFSDKEEDLVPVKGGFFPRAHITQIPSMTGPRRMGLTIKEWIDKTREQLI